MFKNFTHINFTLASRLNECQDLQKTRDFKVGILDRQDITPVLFRIIVCFCQQLTILLFWHVYGCCVLLADEETTREERLRVPFPSPSCRQWGNERERVGEGGVEGERVVLSETQERGRVKLRPVCLGVSECVCVSVFEVCTQSTQVIGMCSQYF